MSLFHSRPRFQRSGLLFVLIKMNEEENYEVASVLGSLDPEPGESRGDAEWCENSLDEIGVQLIFDEIPAEVAGAQSILVTGHMVGEDICTQDGNEYDEHFDLAGIHRVTTMAEVRRALAPLMTSQAVKTWDLANRQPGFKRAWLDAVWPVEDL